LGGGLAALSACAAITPAIALDLHDLSKTLSMSPANGPRAASSRKIAGTPNSAASAQNLTPRDTKMLICRSNAGSGSNEACSSTKLAMRSDSKTRVFHVLQWDDAVRAGATNRERRS